MRLWDRLTGGAAKIQVELEKPVYQPGETLRLRAAITSDGDVEAKSALVTLRGVEEIRYEVPVYEVEHDREDGDRSDRSDRTDRTDWDRDSSSSSFDRRESSSSSDREEELRQVGTEEKRDSNTTISVEERVAGPLPIKASEPYLLEAELRIPSDAPPTYTGKQARHYYQVTVALDVAWSANPSETIDVVIGLGAGA